MIRSTLLVAAGLLAAACFACVAVAPPPPPLQAAMLVCDANTFVAKTQLLPMSYNPDVPPGQYQPPVGTPHAWPLLVQNDLRSAFQNAPAWFQQRLCGMDGIYISCPTSDPNSCFTGATGVFAGAFGFRSRGHDADRGNRYIAISAGLWPSASGPALSLHDYQTRTLQSFPGSGAAKVYTAVPDASWMTVLAALAHEVGHVTWVQTVRQQPEGNYDFTSLINCAGNTIDFFSGWNYNHASPQHPDLLPKGGWRGFATRDNEGGPNYVEHASAPFLSQLNSPPGVPPASYKSLYDLYQFGQPWASLFGAQAPDEDFVETYVMAVLTGYNPSDRSFAGPLSSLPLNIPNFTGPNIPNQWADVPRDLVQLRRKPVLANKMSCIAY